MIKYYTFSVIVLMISLASEAAAAASELLPSLCGFNKDAMLPQSSQQNDTDFFAKRRRSELRNVWNEFYNFDLSNKRMP